MGIKNRLKSKLKSLLPAKAPEPDSLIDDLGANPARASVPSATLGTIPSPVTHGASFDTAIMVILKNEGGYVNDPADAGGPTNFGITQATYAKFKGHAVTANDVRAMPLADAKAIYRDKYWEAAYEELPQGIATALLDWGVLHGPVSARIMAQETLNRIGAKLKADGEFGPLTIAAFKRVSAPVFLSAYSREIKAYFKRIVALKPSQRRFLAGWTKRADRIAQLA